MKIKIFVSEIVGTYEIPEHHKNKIISIAERCINELGLITFEDQYRYISDLVEKFQIPWKEKKALRLDSLIQSDGDNTFHNIIGIDDPNFIDISEDKFDDEKPELSFTEVVPYIAENLPPTYADFILQLIKSPSTAYTLLNDVPKEVSDLIPAIQHRIGILAKIYEKGGEIVFPKRLISSIQFDPFYIRFSPRRYNGNPLTFFEQHRDFFEKFCKSRKQLYWFDAGIYDTLRKNGQLSLAIPHANPFRVELGRRLGKKELKLTEKQLEEIALAHSTYQGNASETARNLPYSYATIINRWKDFKLPVLGKPNYQRKQHKLLSEQIDDIILAHSTYQGNTSEAARHLPYCYATIRKYWKEARFESSEKALGRDLSLSQEKIEKIVAAHSTYQGNALLAAKNLCHSHRTVTKYWMQAELPINQSRRGKPVLVKRLPEDKIKAIISCYYDFDGKAYRAGRSLEVCGGTVLKYWKEAGLPVRRKGEKNYDWTK